MDHAVIHGGERDARNTEDDDSGNDRIEAGEDLPANGVECRHWSHAGKDHSRVDEGIDGAHALEPAITHHADDEPDDNEGRTPQGVAYEPQGEILWRGEWLAFRFEAEQVAHA